MTGAKKSAIHTVGMTCLCGQAPVTGRRPRILAGVHTGSQNPFTFVPPRQDECLSAHEYGLGLHTSKCLDWLFEANCTQHPHFMISATPPDAPLPVRETVNPAFVARVGSSVMYAFPVRQGHSSLLCISPMSTCIHWRLGAGAERNLLALTGIMLVRAPTVSPGEKAETESKRHHPHLKNLKVIPAAQLHLH